MLIISLAKDKRVLVPDCSSKYVCSSSVAVDDVDSTDDSESASNDSTRFNIFLYFISINSTIESSKI